MPESTGRPTTETAEPVDEYLVDLDPDACRRLMAAVEFGRLAFVVQGRPHLVVLNYVTVGDDVLFRTREDAELARLTDVNATVHAVLEADDAFPVGRSGWSVIATGLLSRESDPQRVTLAREAITAWAEGERDTVLRLTVESLTGRQVGRL